MWTAVLFCFPVRDSQKMSYKLGSVQSRVEEVSLKPTFESMSSFEVRGFGVVFQELQTKARSSNFEAAAAAAFHNIFIFEVLPNGVHHLGTGQN